MKAPKDLPEEQRAYRHTVEIRSLHDGASCMLELEVVALIPLKPRTTERDEPARHLLRLKDGQEVLEATDLEEMRVLLREKYPDSGYERRLHVQRDREAEKRREAALDELAGIFADAAVRRLVAEDVAT